MIFAHKIFYSGGFFVTNNNFFYAWLMVNDTCNMDVVPVLHSHVIVEISSQTVLSQRSLLLTLRLSHYWKAIVSVMIWTFEYKLYL